MGFEERIPSIPNREQEIKMIKQIEQEWLQQSSTKLYGNEAPRRNKIDESNLINQVFRRQLVNLVIGLGVSAPFIILIAKMKRMNTKPTGVPFYRSPRYYNPLEKTFNYSRYQQQLSITIPLWLTCGFIYSYRYTNKTTLDDEYYTNKTIHRML